ncbi:MAG TPA: hypothetical protein DCF89_10145 [Flavobacteriales bacterium]|nr:hypothetical protein [Crocinitomicaceae bacterium]HAE31467.1 hypothetical protein [Flavobacteriales bacterium]
MKRFLQHISIFAGIGILLLNGIGYVLDQYYGKLNNQFVDHKANWIFKKNGENLDYAVLGASRAYNVIDINTIDLTAGLTGLNLGERGAGYAECYILLEHFLRKNSTKLLVLSLDYPSLKSVESYSYPFKEYAFLPQFEEDSIEFVFQDVLPPHKFWMYKFVKASKYMEFNSKYPFYDNLIHFGIEQEYQKIEQSKGSKLVNKNQRVEGFNTQDMEEITGKVQFNKLDLRYLRKIIQLCKSNDIELLCYSAPLYKDLYFARGYENINNQIDSLAASWDFEWNDYSFIPLSQQEEYFADNSHLNQAGAKIFSKQLARTISEKLKAN